MTRPELIGSAEVPYPEGGAADALVTLKLLITADGGVEEALALEGEEPFSSAAIESASSWKFSPATVGGKPRAAWVLFQVEFVEPTVEEAPAPEAANPESSTEAEDSESATASPGAELEVTVNAVRHPGIGRVMSDADTEIIPGAEGDPVRAIEAMPGTVPILASGPFLGLRGASPAMVGYEFDGISVPYLFHLARGSAVVHPWLVQSAQIHGTGGPARLGRSGGGFIEAIAAEPEGRARMGGRLRLTDVAGGFEAPFADGRGNAIAAGRYSYTKPLVSLIAPEFSLDYWDYQGRVRYELSPGESVEVLSFGSGDRSAIHPEGEAKEDLFRGSFHRVGVRYRLLDDDGGSLRLGLVAGHDRWDAEPSLIRPQSRSLTARIEGTSRYSEKVAVAYGGDVGVRFQTDFYDAPTEFSGPLTEPVAVNRYEREDLSSALWLDMTYSASRRTTLAAGIRLDVYASTESDLDEASAKWSPQPRFALSHQLTPAVRMRTSVGVASQIKSPAQRPPGRILSPHGGLEHSVLSDAGVEWKLPGSVSIDIGVFQNAFFEVKDVEHLRTADQIRDNERGTGRALGAELALRRTFGRFRGLVAYTLSRSERRAGRVAGLARFDRPHALDVAGAYSFGADWTFSSRATYYSGYPGLVPLASMASAPPRADAYYQVDWQLAKRWSLGEVGWWGLTAGVLNTTLRTETNSLTCAPNGTCAEEKVGPATIPTIGIEGEL